MSTRHCSVKSFSLLFHTKFMASMLHTMIKWFAQRFQKYIYYVEIRIAILTIAVRKGFNKKCLKGKEK